jgi:thioredoxin reductase (NADPH)
MKEQLNGVFSKMERHLLLKLFLDNRPISTELESFITKLAELSDKLTVTVAERDGSSEQAPCVRVYLESGEDTGIAFHGVPGGHEFSSFVLGIYNAIGKGQVIDSKTEEQIQKIDKPTDIKVLVSLSCTMCPDTVVAAQKIAAINKNVRAEIYDIHYFEKLRTKYNVMSVPCIVINDSKVAFGKKNIDGILDLI